MGGDKYHLGVPTDHWRKGQGPRVIHDPITALMMAAATSVSALMYATYTKPSGFPANTNGGTSITVTTVNVGDLLVLQGTSGTGYPTSIVNSGTGTTTAWSQITACQNQSLGYVNAFTWVAVVLTTGSMTITPNVDTYSIAVHAITSSLGSDATWTTTNGEYLQSTASATSPYPFDWPSLVSDVNAGVYVGYATGSHYMVASGTTAGFTYTLLENNDQICYDLDLAASTGYQPIGNIANPSSTVAAMGLIAYATTSTPTFTPSGLGFLPFFLGSVAAIAGPGSGWQAGNFLSRLGIYAGDGSSNQETPSVVANVFGTGVTPPVWSTYPWGCTGAIIQSPGSNGITGACVDAVGRGGKLMVGFPMCGGVDHCTITYAQVLAGNRDADAEYFAATLAANGCGDAYVRMGWEGNQANGAMGTPANYALAVKRLYPIMKAAAPNLQLIWNPTMNSGELNSDLETYYPGDAYIDGVCLDMYDFYFYTNAGGPGVVGSSYPGIATVWPYLESFPAQGQGTDSGTGLDWLLAFGAAHNKWVGFCECGLGYNNGGYAAYGGDNPGFFNNLAAWTMAHATQVKVITLWDSGGSSGFEADNGNNVNSLAAIVSHLNDVP